MDELRPCNIGILFTFSEDKYERNIVKKLDLLFRNNSSLRPCLENVNHVKKDLQPSYNDTTKYRKWIKEMLER